jgi:alkylation response protein AidB-like acyl-CoA dehydrogenase
MTYRAPVDDFRFVFEHIAGLPELLTLPAFSELEPDLIEAVLEENAKFASEVVAPTNWDGDQHPPVHANGVVKMPASYHHAFKQFVEGGWQGLRHPAQWGGQGLPKLLGCAATENLNAGNLAFSLCPLLTDGVIEALLLSGSDKQQKLYIEALVQGKWTGTMNLTEPQAGSDLSLVNTRAVAQVDGTYRLFGQKIYITFG